jgi:hypothetical protein
MHVIFIAFISTPKLGTIPYACSPLCTVRIKKSVVEKDILDTATENK